MKKRLLLLAIIVGAFSCTKLETSDYEGKTYLSFTTDVTQDSVEVSFFFYPGEEYLLIPVEISLGGYIFTEDQPLHFVVNEKNTTALEKNYELPKAPVFRAGMVMDTVYIKLIKTSELNSQRYRLTLSLLPTANYDLGPKANWYNKTIFSAIASKPEWWNSDMEKVYLGKYTQTKFELFMAVTKEGDLSGKSASEIRALALKFKRHLKANPTPDEDGKLMTVTVIGE